MSWQCACIEQPSEFADVLGRPIITASIRDTMQRLPSPTLVKLNTYYGADV
jgi:hypothetical protein